jgi:hypothetical protein
VSLPPHRVRARNQFRHAENRIHDDAEARRHGYAAGLVAGTTLSENVALGPWVHVASDVAHLGVARAGERLVTRGRVADLYERKGHRWVELDVLIVADDLRPVLHVRHVAIYQLRAPEPSGETRHG